MRLDALARAIGARLDGPGDRVITRVAPLDAADADALVGAFLPRFRAGAGKTLAGAAIAPPDVTLPTRCARLVCADPRTAWGKALRLLYPKPAIQPPDVGVHPLAAVHPEAVIELDVHLGPFVTVGPRSRVGAGAQLFPGVVVGADVVVGPRAVLHPNACVLDGCVLGEGVWLGAGAVVGSPGFGLDAAGRVPQVGRVEIGPGATLGAQTCVDRATVGVTRIGAGAHLDNLVQVGHNAQVGDGAVLCGQVGLAGGAVVEAGAVVGGQAGVAGHGRVGAGARVAAQSGVTRSLAPGGIYSGHPAEPNRARLQRLARLRRLVKP